MQSSPESIPEFTHALELAARILPMLEDSAKMYLLFLTSLHMLPPLPCRHLLPEADNLAFCTTEVHNYQQLATAFTSAARVARERAEAAFSDSMPPDSTPTTTTVSKKRRRKSSSSSTSRHSSKSNSRPKKRARHHKKQTSPTTTPSAKQVRCLDCLDLVSVKGNAHHVAMNCSRRQDSTKFRNIMSAPVAMCRCGKIQDATMTDEEWNTHLASSAEHDLLPQRCLCGLPSAEAVASGHFTVVRNLCPQLRKALKVKLPKIAKRLCKQCKWDDPTYINPPSDITTIHVVLRKALFALLPPTAPIDVQPAILPPSEDDPTPAAPTIHPTPWSPIPPPSTPMAPSSSAMAPPATPMPPPWSPVPSLSLEEEDPPSSLEEEDENGDSSAVCSTNKDSSSSSSSPSPSSEVEPPVRVNLRIPSTRYPPARRTSLRPRARRPQWSTD